MVRGTFRLTDALAGLRLFGGALPAVRPAALAAPLARQGTSDPLGRDAGPGRVGSPRRVFLPSLDGRRVPARQVDETTCGSAVLTMLAMAGEPRLAAWVAEDPGPRFDALQLRVHRATARAGLLPWPLRFGTTPWDAATVARYGTVRYTHRVVGRGARGAVVLRAAVTAAASGTPAPIFSGGDLSRGWQAAVPRHVVLLTAADAETVQVYEPSSATIHTLPIAVLVNPDTDTPDRALLTRALGGWPHAVWALLPA